MSRKHRTGKSSRKLQQKRKLSLQLTEYHSGPLPKPETLLRYDEISKGFAERVIRMAEKEQEANIFIKKKLAKSANLMIVLGWIASWSVAFGFLLMVYFAISNKMPWVALVLVSAIGLSAKFLYVGVKQMVD